MLPTASTRSSRSQSNTVLWPGSSLERNFVQASLCGATFSSLSSKVVHAFGGLIKDYETFGSRSSTRVCYLPPWRSPQSRCSCFAARPCLVPFGRGSLKIGAGRHFWLEDEGQLSVTINPFAWCVVYSTWSRWRHIECVFSGGRRLRND